MRRHHILLFLLIVAQYMRVRARALRRHARVPLRRAARRHELDRALVDGARAPCGARCVPPGRRVQADEGDDERVQEERHAICATRRVRLTRARAEGGMATCLKTLRMYVTWSISRSWTYRSSSSVADMNSSLHRRRPISVFFRQSSGQSVAH